MSQAVKHTSRKARAVFAALFAAVLSVSLVVGTSLAQADSLNDKKNATQTKIDDNKKDISKAEAEVQAAQAAVASTQKQLDAAKADLAAKTQVTDQAKAEDQRLASSLADAEAEVAARQADLQAAQDAVTKGEQDLASQRDTIGLVAQTTAQQNTGLLSLSILFTDFDMAQINNRLQWANTSFMATQNAMDQLVATQAALETAQANAQTAEDAASAAAAVAQQQRDAAAAHLKVTQQAQADAQKAQDQVNTQLAANQKAQSDANKALADAQAEQKQLDSDMQQILAQINAQLKTATSSNTTSKAAPKTGTFFYRPVPGRVTSPYGMRYHPILHVWKMHEGVDFGAACGTPIHAAESGTVTMASWYGGYGNYVAINHGKIGGNSYSTGYGHMSKFAVHKGQKVKRGQVIGYVGTTGLSTGCHLHFNVFKNGKTINGLPLVS